MPSKLREYDWKENQVETYLKEVVLEYCIQKINYNETREEEIM